MDQLPDIFQKWFRRQLYIALAVLLVTLTTALIALFLGVYFQIRYNAAVAANNGFTVGVDDFYVLFYMLAGLTGGLAIGLTIYLISKNRLIQAGTARYSPPEWQQIVQEYTQQDYLFSDRERRTVFSRNYLYNFNSYPDVLRWGDIVWVFGMLNRLNGVAVNNTVIVYSRDQARHILNVAFSDKKQQSQRDELVRLIAGRCPQALIGYQPATIQSAKDYYGIDVNRAKSR